MNEPGKKLLTVKELAAALAVKESWVYTKVAAGKIPCIHVGRYVRFDLMRVMGWLTAEQRAMDEARPA